MNLSFSQTWGKEMGDLAGKPTYFIAKIWKGLEQNKLAPRRTYYYYDNKCFDKTGRFFDEKSFLKPKTTTIRYDPHNRWKIGNKIHFIINNRTKNRFQFAPVLEVKSVQKFEIDRGVVCIDNTIFYDPWIGKYYPNDDSYRDMERLAQNDGFPSVEYFFRYFNQDLGEGWKIISWVDGMKY